MKRLRVLTVAICVLWAGAAAAQTASVLVSNFNQGTDIDQNNSGHHRRIGATVHNGRRDHGRLLDHRHHDRDEKS